MLITVFDSNFDTKVTGIGTFSKKAMEKKKSSSKIKETFLLTNMDDTCLTTANTKSENLM